MGDRGKMASEAGWLYGHASSFLFYLDPFSMLLLRAYSAELADEQNRSSLWSTDVGVCS